MAYIHTPRYVTAGALGYIASVLLPILTDGAGIDIDATAPTPNFFVIQYLIFIIFLIIFNNKFPLAFYLQPEAHKVLRLTYDKNTTLNSIGLLTMQLQSLTSRLSWQTRTKL